MEAIFRPAAPPPDVPSVLGRSVTGLSRAEAAFQALRAALQDGIWRPGDRLREEEVAQRLGVSRTPIREAMGRLVALGHLEPAAGRGLIVRRLDPADVLELYAMREILEGAAARLAAEHAADPQIDALRDVETSMAAPATDAATLARLNRVFHEAVVQAARNRYLERGLRELQERIVLLGPTTYLVDERPQSAASEHRAIVAAIAARDADRAEASARAHIRSALRARLRLLHG